MSTIRQGLQKPELRSGKQLMQCFSIGCAKRQAFERLTIHPDFSGQSPWILGFENAESNAVAGDAIRQLGQQMLGFERLERSRRQSP